MHKARLVRFGAGKAHLGAASHALRVLVETRGLALWHCRPHEWVMAPGKLTIPQLESCGNQPEFALHTLKVSRTKADMPTRFPGRGIVKSANQVICRQNTYAAHNAATRAASAAQAFSRPMRCSSLTIVSMLFGTSIRDPQSQKPAAASEATRPTEVTILSLIHI